MIGNISSIETLGLVDGPGVRYVIFLQGCPLRCKFCHNPETWDISNNKRMSVDELMADINKYKAYFGSEGGITVSGGEPLLQKDFVKELFTRCREENINTCLDTSGYGVDYEELLLVTDLVMLSIKGLNSKEYKDVTGADFDLSLKFLYACDKLNKNLWLRHVIINDVNDTEEYILRFKEYIKDIKNVLKVELLPYQTLGVTKYDKLGIPYALKDVLATSNSKIEALYKILNN